jgi:pimeloyl-ACP methyl ester carboxylesterase
MSDCIRSTHLLLLPGMMCDARMWRAQTRDLLPHCQVQVGAIDGAESVALIAAQLLAAAPARFALAGLSMGGILALEMWRQAPARIERMALLDTNPHADLPQRKRLRQGQIDKVRAGKLDSVLREELKPHYLARCNKTNLALLDAVLEMGLQQGESTFVRQSLALRDRPDSTAMLATITCPSLVLCGAEDELCPVAVHQFMAKAIPNAWLQVVPDCGHLSTMEQPDAVSAALQAWLQAA